MLDLSLPQLAVWALLVLVVVFFVVFKLNKANI